MIPPPAHDPETSEPLSGRDAPVGSVVAGKYRIEGALGCGAMGVVMSATHVQLGHRVAIKFLQQSEWEHEQGEQLAARFLREARALCAISSEHVTKVLDVGSLESGEPYMVMELLTGTTLDEVLRVSGPLPIGEVVDYVLQAGEAIAEAHSLGIVHRDIKPGNLFLTRRADGSALIKVLDFGISKMADSEVAPVRLTATGSMLGSPAYMAPEQIRNARDVDARSDLWALGVTLTELCTGHIPFDADTLQGILAKIMADHPVLAGPDGFPLPEPLMLAIDGCLVKDRNGRLQTVGQLAAMLEPLAPKGHVSIPRIQRLSHEEPMRKELASSPDSYRHLAHTRSVGPATKRPSTLRSAFAGASVTAAFCGALFLYHSAAPDPARSATQQGVRVSSASGVAPPASLRPASPANPSSSSPSPSYDHVTTFNDDLAHSNEDLANPREALANSNQGVAASSHAHAIPRASAATKDGGASPASGEASLEASAPGASDAWSQPTPIRTAARVRASGDKGDARTISIAPPPSSTRSHLIDDDVPASRQ